MKRSLQYIFVLSLVLSACGGGSSSLGSGYSSGGSYSSDYDPYGDKGLSQEADRLIKEADEWERQNPSSGSNAPRQYPFGGGDQIRRDVFGSDRQRRLNDEGYDALGDNYKTEAGASKY